MGNFGETYLVRAAAQGMGRRVAITMVENASAYSTKARIDPSARLPFGLGKFEGLLSDESYSTTGLAISYDGGCTS